MSDNDIPWTKLILACAWCRRMVGEDGLWREAWTLLDGEALTHGICPDCLRDESLESEG